MVKKTLLILCVLFLGISSWAQTTVDLKPIYGDLRDRSDGLEAFQKNKNYIRIKSSSVFQGLSKTKLTEENVLPLIGIFYIDAFRRVQFNDSPVMVASNWRLIENALEQAGFSQHQSRTEHRVLMNTLFTQMSPVPKYQLVDRLYPELKKAKNVQPMGILIERFCLVYYSHLSMDKAQDCAKFLADNAKFKSDRLDLLTYQLIGFYESLNFKGYEDYIKKNTKPNAPTRASNQAFQTFNLEFLRNKSAEALKAINEVLGTKFPETREVEELVFTSYANKGNLLIYRNEVAQVRAVAEAMGRLRQIKDLSGFYRYTLMMTYFFIKTKDYPSAERVLRDYFKVDPNLGSVRDEVRLYGLLCTLEMKKKAISEDCKKIAKRYKGLENIKEMGVSVLFTAEVLAKVENPKRKFSPGILPGLSKRPDLEVYKLAYELAQ